MNNILPRFSIDPYTHLFLGKNSVKIILDSKVNKNMPTDQGLTVGIVYRIIILSFKP